MKRMLCAAVLAILAFVAPSVALSAQGPVRVINIDERVFVPLLPVTNPCVLPDPTNPLDLPDIVLLSGTLHISGDLNVEADGGVRGRLHYNAAGIKGEGFEVTLDPLTLQQILTPTGVKYNAVGTGQIRIDAELPFPVTERSRLRFALISQGNEDNFFVTIDADVKIDENGNVTLDNLELIDAECRG